MNITITFAFPDKEVLSAIGRLAIISGHLDYILKMTFKSLKGISIVEALQHTNKKTGTVLRKKVIDLAKERLVSGAALEELLNFIDRAWSAAEKRNQYIHNLWARQNYDQLLLQQDDLNWRTAPTKDEIDDIINEISNILVELNESRLLGSLADALDKSQLPQQVYS